MSRDKDNGVRGIFEDGCGVGSGYGYECGDGRGSESGYGGGLA